MQDLQQILNKKFSYIKVPRDIVYRLLDEGRDAELMLFLMDTVIQEIKGRKFAIRTMVDKIRNATISRSSVALYRKEKVEFEEEFQDYTNNYKRYSTKASKPKPKPTPKNKPKPPKEEPDTKDTTPPKQEPDTKDTTDTTPPKAKPKPKPKPIIKTLQDKIKNNILDSKLIAILKKNFEYIKRYIVEVMNSQESFDIFAIEFYDYIYPNKKISDIKKIWYVNSFKDKILNKDYRTIENIKNFYENKQMHLAYVEIQSKKGQGNMV